MVHQLCVKSWKSEEKRGDWQTLTWWWATVCSQQEEGREKRGLTDTDLVVSHCVFTAGRVKRKEGIDRHWPGGEPLCVHSRKSEEKREDRQTLTWWRATVCSQQEEWREKRGSTDTDLVVSHCVLEVGVKTGSELQQPGPLGLQRGHVGLHDACGRVAVQNQGAPFLLHCVEVTLTRLQLTDETLEARKWIWYTQKVNVIHNYHFYTIHTYHFHTIHTYRVRVCVWLNERILMSLQAVWVITRWGAINIFLLLCSTQLSYPALL